MASGQTANYQLNQWEAEDKVLRTEFNADNAKLDAALAAHDGELAAHAAALEDKLESGDLSSLEQRAAALEGRAKLVTGVYIGDGQVSQKISLGATPKAVLVFPCNGAISNSANNHFGGLAPPDHPAVMDSEGTGETLVSIESGGFRVYQNFGEKVLVNFLDYLYYYLAWI